MEPYRARLFRETRNRFAALRDERVFIYWPHGLGDFVHFGHVLPALEPSNRYAIGRYGDEFTALYDGDAVATPIRTGVANIRNAYGASLRDYHLGVSHRKADGREHMLSLTAPLARALREQSISSVLWTDYPDPAGRRRYPHHTKARSLLADITTKARRAELDLESPLPSSLRHVASDAASAVVDDFIAARCKPGESLCLLLAGGHTAPQKNWSSVDLRATIDGLSHLRPQLRPLLLDPEFDMQLRTHPRLLFFSDLMVVTTLPFVEVLRALYARARLFIGIPAGPFHLAVAGRRLPCIGLWTRHHPLLYDEPTPLATHLIAASVDRMGLSRSRGVLSVPPSWRQSLRPLTTDGVPTAEILAAVSELLGSAT